MRALTLGTVIAALVSTMALAQDRGCNEGQVTELRRPFQPLSGTLYLALLPQHRSIANTNEEANRSPLVLCENGKRLGPAHALSDDIARKGEGRYTHFTNGVYFSASDNTNANTNGRKYTIAVPNRR